VNGTSFAAPQLVREHANDPGPALRGKAATPVPRARRP
jgi:hypothetical protein